MDNSSLNSHGDGVEEPVRGRIERLLGLASNLFILLTASLLAALIGGFFIFLNSVSTLSTPVEPKAEAIVVLTGGYQRIEQAVELLASGAGKRLLISGVNKSITLTQIRRFTKAPQQLFDCCVDIGYDALDTAGNAQEAVRWIKARGFGSVIVVTNNYHMPRSLVELRRIDGETRYIAYPVEGGFSLSDIVSHPYILVTLSGEYIKTLMVLARDYIPMPNVH